MSELEPPTQPNPLPRGRHASRSTAHSGQRRSAQQPQRVRTSHSCSESPSQNWMWGEGRVTHSLSGSARYTCARTREREHRVLICRTPTQPEPLAPNSPRLPALHTGLPGARAQGRPATAAELWRRLQGYTSTRLAAERFGPVRTGVVEVRVADGYGLHAAQPLHLRHKLWVQQSKAVPQHLQATSSLCRQLRFSLQCPHLGSQSAPRVLAGASAAAAATGAASRHGPSLRGARAPALTLPPGVRMRKACMCSEEERQGALATAGRGGGRRSARQAARCPPSPPHLLPDAELGLHSQAAGRDIRSCARPGGTDAQCGRCRQGRHRAQTSRRPAPPPPPHSCDPTPAAGPGWPKPAPLDSRTAGRLSR